EFVVEVIDVTEGYFRNWDAATGGTDPTAPMGLQVMATTLDDHAKDFRKLPREEALERFKKNALKLDKMLDDLTPKKWEGGLMVSHPYSGAVPAGFYATFQIMDYGVHPYDIEYGLGNKLATIDEATAGCILPFAFIFWQYQVDQKQAAGQDFQYGIDVAGPWGGKWRITVKVGNWSTGHVTVTFEGIGELFKLTIEVVMMCQFYG